MTGIYKITNTINNKCYIGKSEVDIIYRLNQHKNGKESNEHLQRSIQKYGIENFTFEILEECSKENCCDREKYWIKYYNSLYPNGYNYTTGGENQSGFQFSEHSKQKMSQSAKARCNTDTGRKEMSKRAQKRVWTDAEKESVSNTLKERFKDKTLIPVYGRKRINNGVIEKLVKPEDLDMYFNNGYVLGKLPKRN